MSNGEQIKADISSNIVSAKFIFFGGAGLFITSLVLYVFRYLGIGMASFIMCVGFGLIFVASGANADIQAKAENAATAHWLGGFAFPLIRFTGAVAITVVLLGVLAFLGPKLVVDSVRYARILVRANHSLAPYEMWVSTDKSGLVGSVRQKGRNIAPRDFEFIAFMSDIEGGATGLELNLKTTNPQATKDVIADIAILDLPLSLVWDHIGRATSVIDLDLTTSALRSSDGKCYFDKRQDNPCSTGAGSTGQRATELKPWFDNISIVSTAAAQSDAGAITTAALADLSPAGRAQAYSELLAKGAAVFPAIANDLPDLKAKWLANPKDPGTYYQLLGALNLAVELSDRGSRETNLFRAAVADKMTKDPKASLTPVRALAELASVDDRSIRMSATRALANVVDNNTVSDVLGTLKSGVNDNGQFNLLLTLEPISGFACRENADAIIQSLDLIEKRIDQATPDQYGKTKGLISKIKRTAAAGKNKDVGCDLYWRSLGGGQIIR